MLIFFIHGPKRYTEKKRRERNLDQMDSLNVQLTSPSIHIQGEGPNLNLEIETLHVAISMATSSRNGKKMSSSTGAALLLLLWYIKFSTASHCSIKGGFSFYFPFSAFFRTFLIAKFINFFIHAMMFEGCGK